MQVLHADYDIKPEDANDLGHDGMLKLINDKLGRTRIYSASGDWSIRRSLSFCDQADLVVGPETGVLNCAAFLDTPKVCMLSHSSNVNLTRDWVNTTVIEPQNVECYPCHRLHYNRDFCPEDAETGASVCAAAIKPETVFDAIMKVFR